MKKLLFILFICSSFCAQAEPFDWSACKEEIASWCPEEKDDEKIYACLHAYDGELSKSCDRKSVTPYEEKTGKPK